MSQSGYTPILIYASGTASAVPLAANMTSSSAGAELALNYADGKLYFKNSSGVVTLLAQAGSSGVTTFSAGTTGFTPSTATTGAVTLAGTLATANGGTNLTSFTSGGALYATSTSVLATGTLPNTAGGTGQASAFTQYGVTYASTTTALATTAAGTTTTVLHGNAAGAPTFGAVSLTADVSGTLPIANGGTGATTLTANNVLLGNGTSALQVVAPGTTGNVLTSNGTTWVSQASNAYPQIQPISASVSANALTISASSLNLWFRSTTLGSGTTTNVTGTPANLVVPSSATLGTVSAVQSRLVVIALNNAGTIELAVVNISGGTQLDETNLLTTTTISSGSTSASTVYSTTARTSVAYRVIGFIDSTQTTAGTWATAPSIIQGVGGQALAALSSLGYGQTYQVFNSSTRASGTTYYNTTGKPIYVAVSSETTGYANANFTINGVSMMTVYGGSAGASNSADLFFTVPPGASYSASLSVWAYWVELR